METANPHDTDTVGKSVVSKQGSEVKIRKKANNMDFTGNDPVKLITAEGANRL